MKRVTHIVIILLLAFNVFSQKTDCISGNCDNGFGTWKMNNGSVYKGSWKNKQMDGFGEYKFANGNYYKGEFKADKMDGFGTYIFKNGDKYVGQWKYNKYNGKGSYFSHQGKIKKGLWANGKFLPSKTNKGGCISGNCDNGYGTYVFKTGEKYIGNWKNLKRNKTGVNYYTNGEWYEGEWKDDKTFGQGTFYYADGSKYIGEWRNNHPNGYGIYTAPDGSKKDGLWEDGRFVSSGKNNYGCISGDCNNDYGVFSWRTGEKYFGQWTQGKRNGKGTNIYANGDKYVGHWKNDKREGYGKYTMINGKSKEGFFKNDEYIGTELTKYGCISGNCETGYGIFISKKGTKYKGTFKNGKYDGQGIINYVDGSSYSGEFKNALFHGFGTFRYGSVRRKYSGDFAYGKFNGKGTMYLEDGRTQAGIWENNQFKGSGKSQLKIPAISWINPKNTTQHTIKNELELKLCIKSKDILSNVEIYVNDQLKINNAQRGYNVVDAKCDYTIARKVQLYPGENKIQVKVSNASGTGTSDIKTVFYDASKNEQMHRYALVMGNSDYKMGPLRNPKNDAKAMGTELKKLGFDVMEYTDLTKDEMIKHIREFGNKIASNKGVGLVFYAGHGLQVGGENYILPIDAMIKNYQDIEDQAVNLSRITGEMAYAKNDLNIIILDACRNNPFEGIAGKAPKGLASTSAPSGSFLAFATAPGSVAADGSGKNGLYTQELLKAIDEPSKRIEDVFKEVRRNVYKLSDEQQVPWENSSIFSDFYFKK